MRKHGIASFTGDLQSFGAKRGTHALRGVVGTVQGIMEPPGATVVTVEMVIWVLWIDSNNRQGGIHVFVGLEFVDCPNPCVLPGHKKPTVLDERWARNEKGERLGSAGLGRASLDHRGGSPFAIVTQSENTRIGVTEITPREWNDFSTSKDADQSELKKNRDKSRNIQLGRDIKPILPAMTRMPGEHSKADCQSKCNKAWVED